ncbi:hypothetical protein [Bartonella harrusi]|uniref:Uncharacterized protein n=1 Tax=Bartonella harrusi TaxID=2961895 RepID=A0ABY5EUD0_9HYPH|nr:hypothetical protein [Bartonella harrusi]UTO28093.1 hypothetical protein NMK50_07785 [Bartonella harrusi]
MMLWQVGKMLDEDEMDLWFDQVTLNHDILSEFLSCDVSIKEPEYLNFITFKEGIEELEQNKIVAKGTKKDCYFINPDVFGIARQDEECVFHEDEEGEVDVIFVGGSSHKQLL